MLEKVDLFEYQDCTLWEFPKRAYTWADREVGFYKGCKPAQVVFNLLKRYTKFDDLVFDPFSGSGVVGDVSFLMHRRFIGYDVNPLRKFILKHDSVKDDWPVDVDFIFLDPPYYGYSEAYNEKDYITPMSVSEYTDFVRLLAVKSFKSLKDGGVVAIAMNSTITKYVYFDGSILYNNVFTENFGLVWRRFVVKYYMTRGMFNQNVESGDRLGFYDIFVFKKIAK